MQKKWPYQDDDDMKQIWLRNFFFWPRRYMIWTDWFTCSLKYHFRCLDLSNTFFLLWITLEKNFSIKSNVCHERIKWGVFSLLEPRHLSQDLELELWMKMKLHFWLFAKSKFWYLLFSLALCKGRRKLWRGKVISRIPISGNVFAFQIYLGNCSYIYKWENKCIFIWNILSKMYLKNTLCLQLKMLTANNTL